MNEEEQETKEFQVWAKEQNVDEFFVVGALSLSKLARNSLVTKEVFDAKVEDFATMRIELWHCQA